MRLYHRAVDSLLAVLIVLLILVVIWRGPKTLPQIGSMLGRGVKGARKEIDDVQKGSDTADPTDGPTS